MQSLNFNEFLKELSFPIRSNLEITFFLKKIEFFCEGKKIKAKKYTDIKRIKKKNREIF